MRRRKFLRNSLTAGFGTIILPTIVPSTIFGKNAPSNKIIIGQIGFGRIAMTHDLPETLKYDSAMVLAVADVDSKRVTEGKNLVPNVSGMTFRDAIYLLERSGLRVFYEGKGRVKQQSLTAGARMTKGDRIYLRLG